MLRLVAPFSIEEIFANAGMSVVERSLVRSLVETGRVQLRLLAHGDEQQQRRFAEACRSLNAGPLLEVVPFTRDQGLEVLDGMDGMMVHGLPPAFFPWLLANDITRLLPVIQHIHSLCLIDFEIDAYAALWAGWHGDPPARWVAPSFCTARRARLLSRGSLAHGATFPAVSVVPHGVFAQEFSSGGRQRGREILGAQDHEFVMLSLNRLSPEKCDYEQLVHAFHQLVDSTPAIALRLALIGGLAPDDVDYLCRIQSLLKDLGLDRKSIVIAHLDERDKPDVLAAADLFISLACNPQESFGVALLEAQAAGLPVIATDWNGYKEVLPSFYQGNLVPTVASHEVARNVDWRRLSQACAPEFCALVRTMQRFIADSSLRNEAAESGRQNARNFTWNAAASRLLDLWAQVTNPSGLGVAATFEAITGTQPAQSPIDGMATTDLRPDLNVEVTSRPASRLQPLALPERLHALLASSHNHVISVGQWRQESNLAVASADELLLQAVREGLLTVQFEGINAE